MKPSRPYIVVSPLRPLGWGCLLLCGMGTGRSLAQEAGTGVSPVFPPDRHRELKEELTYTPPELEEEEPEVDPFEWDLNFDWLSEQELWFNLLALLLILLPLGYFIYHLLGVVVERRRRRRAAAAGGAVEISEIQEEKMVMHGVALSLVERAEAAGQYDVAVRLRYIQLLKDLNDRRLIRYRKDFSNRDYHRQLAGNELLPDLRTVTADYERYWYGKYAIDRLSYRLVRNKFEHLGQRVLASYPTENADHA